MSMQSPVLVTRDEGERFHFLSTLHTAKIYGEQTNGVLTAVEFLAPRNFGPPLHRHEAEDELFYILTGELWLSCGDVEAVHGEGSVVWLPRGLPHTFQVRSETARVSRSPRPRDSNGLWPHSATRPIAGLCPTRRRSIPRKSRRYVGSSPSKCSALRPHRSPSRQPAPPRRLSLSARSRLRARRR